MEVFFSELAEYKLEKLTEYLLKQWNQKVKKDFLAKLTAKVEQISQQPESCPNQWNLVEPINAW